MSVQTRKNTAQSIGTTLWQSGSTWLWIWSGECFGYRTGDKLFTADGLQVGRFVGREVYGPDGSYLGEIGSGADAIALVTNSYRRSQRQAGFVPVLENPQETRPAQPRRPLYSGHDNFPAPEALKEELWHGLPVAVQRALRARRQPSRKAYNGAVSAPVAQPG